MPTITGIGGALGERLITNDELIAITGINSSDRWIQDHAGIATRYWANENTHAPDLATLAARQALEMAGVEAKELSAILLSTITPAYLGGPYTVTEVHKRLGGNRSCFVHEFSGACCGGVVGLSLASKEVLADPSAKVLVLGSEVLSRVINTKDRSSAILFGDASGAAVVEAREIGPGLDARDERPVFSFATKPDREAIYAPAGGTVEPGEGADDPRRKLHLNGPVVTEHAMDLMPGVLIDAVQRDNAWRPTGRVDWGRYDLFVPHQANGKLIRMLGEGLHVPEEKRILTVDQHGNTSSASIFLAIRTAFENGQLDEPGRFLLTSVAAGMISAAGAMNYKLRPHDVWVVR